MPRIHRYSNFAAFIGTGAVLGFAIMALAAPESTDPGSGTRIDWSGLALLSVGLFAVVDG